MSEVKRQFHEHSLKDGHVPVERAARPRRQIGIVVEDRAEGEISQAQAGACRQGAVKRRRPDRPVLARGTESIPNPPDAALRGLKLQP